MTRIRKVKAALACETLTPRPWGYVGIKPSEAATVAAFTTVEDCEVAALAVNVIEDMLALVSAVEIIESRLAAGKLPLKAQRAAILAALARVKS